MSDYVQFQCENYAETVCNAKTKQFQLKIEQLTKQITNLSNSLKSTTSKPTMPAPSTSTPNPRPGLVNLPRRFTSLDDINKMIDAQTISRHDDDTASGAEISTSYEKMLKIKDIFQKFCRMSILKTDTDNLSTIKIAQIPGFDLDMFKQIRQKYRLSKLSATDCRTKGITYNIIALFIIQKKPLFRSHPLFHVNNLTKFCLENYNFINDCRIHPKPIRRD